MQINDPVEVTQDLDAVPKGTKGVIKAFTSEGVLLALLPLVNNVELTVQEDQIKVIKPAYATQKTKKQRRKKDSSNA